MIAADRPKINFFHDENQASSHNNNNNLRILILFWNYDETGAVAEL